MNKIIRTTQKLVNGMWQPTLFYNLKQGDCFRMFDNITPVSHDGKCVFVATSELYFSEEGNYRIDYETC